jgi:hypothetical protein
MPLISLQISPDIAIKLRFMMESGVFDIRDGSATLHFDKKGFLQKIERKLFTVASDAVVDT